jgi:HAMP domain-containing protein
MTETTTLEASWSVKRISVLAQKSSSALDEDAKRLNRLSRKFTDRVSRKDTMANRMKLEEIQALAGEIQDMKRSMQEVRSALPCHSNMPL